MIVSSKLSPVAHNNDLNKHMEEPPATFVYICPEQKQCRRVLNYVCCLWSVCTSALSMREQSIEGARPPFGIGSGASASWPRPHSVRRINHVYLSTYFSQTSSVAWHWLAGVFCLSLSQSRPTIESLRTPPHYTGCSLWRRKNSQNSHFQRTHRRLFPLPLSPRVGRTLI